MSGNLELVSAEAEPATGETRGGCIAKCFGGCCCCLLISLILLYVFVVPPVFAGIGISIFLSLELLPVHKFVGDGYDLTNLSYKTDWQGCVPWEPGGTLERLSDDCIDDCFDPEAPRELQASIDATPGQLVYYTSRETDGIETVRLGGWLLPAEGNSVEAPRIVVQHGFAGNSNEAAFLLTAVRLRELGFTVLVNNFRDHGYSNDSQNHMVEWGNAYPYDLLGAWDYLVNDPDLALGGAMTADRVSIAGFSMGGFTALNAFGLESRIPGVWVDSPVFRPKDAFGLGLFTTLGDLGLGFLKSDWLLSAVWDRMKAYARDKGVDLEMNMPEKNLPMGPDTGRRLMINQNPDDQLVPGTEMEKIRSFLDNYPEKYVVEHFYIEESCPIRPGRWSLGAHIVGVFQEPDLYGRKMCEFFRSLFEQDASTCVDPGVLI